MMAAKKTKIPEKHGGPTSSSTMPPALMPPRARTIYIFLGFLSISWLSLFLAYGPYSTPAWLSRFGQCDNPSWHERTGALIEGGRSLLLLLMSFYILEVRFQDETTAFLGICHRWKQRSLLVCRFLFVIALIYVAQDQIRHHIYDGPLFLRDHAYEHGIRASADNVALRNYLTYLPYSLVNYLVVVAPLFSIPLYAFTIDFQRIWHACKMVEETREPQDPKDLAVCNFRLFRRICEKVLNRYLDVLAVLTLAVHYDYWLGYCTLTDEGINSMFLGCVLVGSAAAFIIIISSVYQRGYGDIVDRLSTAEHGDSKFRRENNLLTWLIACLRDNIAGVILLGLVIVPLAHFVQAMVKAANMKGG